MKKKQKYNQDSQKTFLVQWADGKLEENKGADIFSKLNGMAISDRYKTRILVGISEVHGQEFMSNYSA